LRPGWNRRSLFGAHQYRIEESHMKIYAGNLPHATTETELKAAFAAHGTVDSCHLITDRDTGAPRGFGFIEMKDAEASAAIAALNGSDMGGRTIKVNEAKPKEGGRF
jgi:RNA recognition motif-containing protein